MPDVAGDEVDVAGLKRLLLGADEEDGPAADPPKSPTPGSGAPRRPSLPPAKASPPPLAKVRGVPFFCLLS